MSYEVKYDLSNPAVAQYKALKDCCEFLGKKEFNKVAKILETAEPNRTMGYIKFCLMLRGIQGYPAEVMAEKFYFKTI